MCRHCNAGSSWKAITPFGMIRDKGFAGSGGGPAPDQVGIYCLFSISRDKDDGPTKTLAVTVPESLVALLDRIAESKGWKRSKAASETIRVYVGRK
jgi:hypothetical protein